MRTFGDVAGGRDNNFNLMRLLAASFVLASHSVALSTGQPAAEPLRALLGVSLGDIAVDLFFVTSGFLVTGSLLARRDLAAFAAGRALRIYPGLWIALLLTVLVAGGAFTTLPANEFFASHGTWDYLRRNAIIPFDVAFELPGTFEHLPYPRIVNGSLWTLPPEMKMYALLGATWLAVALLRKRLAIDWRWLCAAIAVAAIVADMSMFLSHAQTPLMGWLARFFAGAALQSLKGSVPASRRLAVGLLLVTLAAAAFSPLAFGVVYRLTAPWLFVFAALVPAGAIRAANRLGDYSYGLYIYGFPVQQAIVSLWHGVAPLPLLAASVAVTLTLAAASWHLVEQPMLRLKRWIEPAERDRLRARVVDRWLTRDAAGRA